MKRACLFLASLALVPLSQVVSAPPASAQANCRWDLNGEWVGQKTGNRVLMEMRPGGFITWVSGQPKPGQNEANNVFRDAGAKAWALTFRDGQKTYARLEANGSLRVSNPDGWYDIFTRVSPASPPQCVSANPRATRIPDNTGGM